MQIEDSREMKIKRFHSIGLELTVQVTDLDWKPWIVLDMELICFEWLFFCVAIHIHYEWDENK